MLSIVLVVGRQRERANESLRKVLAQEVSEPLEAVVADIEPEAGPLPAANDPRVRVLSLSGLRNYPMASATAAKATQGELVAFIEDHCHAQPGWAQGIVDAFEARPEAAVVNYAFVDAEPKTYLTQSFLMAEYGRWLHPTAPGPIPIGACNNIAYRREWLLRYVEEKPLEIWLRVEYLLQRRIQRDGGVIWQSSDALAAHEDWTSLIEGFEANCCLKRFHAAYAVEGPPRWGWGRRLLYAGGMAVMPALATWRIFRALIPRPRLWGQFVAALPVIVSVHTLASGSEALGYLFGPGDSEEGFVLAELERLRR